MANHTTTDMTNKPHKNGKFSLPLSLLAPSFEDSCRSYGKTCTDLETKLCQAADGENLVILAFIIFD